MLERPQEDHRRRRARARATHPRPTSRWVGWLRGVALGLTLGVVAAGCTPGAGLPTPGPTETPAPTATPGPTAAAPSFEPVPELTVALTEPPPAAIMLQPLEAKPAPTQQFDVQRRELILVHEGRLLRTVIFLPVRPTRGSLANAAFPLVLFSHGLRGSPEVYESSLRTVAAAGFVVAAPEYPHTSRDAADYNPVDLVNQPADASTVITAILDFNRFEHDPLFGYIDPNRVAAMGHSAGGYTTMGMLGAFRDGRLRAAVVLAGGSLGGPYTYAAVPVLFVHGDADPVVPYRQGRAAYDQLPWPKAFLTIIDGGHSDFLDQDSRAAEAVTETVIDFLRAMLYGDILALARISTEATVDTVTRFESLLDVSGGARDGTR